MDVLRKMEASASMKLRLFYPLSSPQMVWRWWKTNCFLTKKKKNKSILLT